MDGRESITRVEDNSSSQPSSSMANIHGYARIQGDYSGTSGSHNIAGSGNITAAGNVTNHGHMTNHGTTTNNYFAGTNSRLHDAQILRCLYTSSYQSHLGRVREPADGTCTWVTEHPKYKAWLEKNTSGVLWLSADPGCGKSVTAAFLAKHLKLWTNTIVCYFFFKDDSEEQRSATFALCALLHQLLGQRNALFRYAEEVFKAKGKRFTDEVDTLWDILVKAVAEGGCGEVICVVDALDECDEGTLAQFTRCLTGLAGSETLDIPLKFLLTGRPYHRIEREIGSPGTTVRLRGEDEVNAISTDVARVIDEGVRDLESYWQQPGGLGYLRELLKSSADRTFLWVSLILDILKNSVDGSRERFTNIVTTAPRDIPELYTNILNKSADAGQARRILHIVVAAARPLTLWEINVAFRMRRGYATIRDIGDDAPGSETTVKNLCGLFVRVIDSRVYLVHQTAREFLIKGTLAGQGEWQYTLSPVDSNFIFADICIAYLSLEEFETDPLVVGPPGRETLRDIHVHFRRYPLLRYAACHWAGHFRDSHQRQMELFESTRLICQRGSSRFLTWLNIYRGSDSWGRLFATDFTHLMIASWLGQHAVVKQLLKDGGDINAQSEGYGTALNIAALREEQGIARLLMKKGVRAYLDRKEYNILLTTRSELERARVMVREREEKRLREYNTLDYYLVYGTRDHAELAARELSVIEFLERFCIRGVRDLPTLPSRVFNSLR